MQLTYAGKREKYQLSGKPVKDKIAEGEFGSLLLAIFEPGSQTRFEWDHWTILRKRLTQVYTYSTDREHSNYQLAVGIKRGERKLAIVGRHGLIYADDATKMIMRVTGEADNIPQSFPAMAVSSVVDYTITDLGGSQFVLPLRMEQQTGNNHQEFKTIVQAQSESGSLF